MFYNFFCDFAYLFCLIIRSNEIINQAANWNFFDYFFDKQVFTF